MIFSAAARIFAIFARRWFDHPIRLLPFLFPPLSFPILPFHFLFPSPYPTPFSPSPFAPQIQLGALGALSDPPVGSGAGPRPQNAF